MSNKIIHIDMDCFYAAVEIRDNPELQKKAVAVGAKVEQRGVLTTCNYEARKYGLHSAMSTVRALQLCPNLILLPVLMNKYRQVSAEIHAIFRRYTDKIEPLSLDEAYLDVTGLDVCRGSATLLAKHIRAEIYKEVGLTASAGIAPNKFLAKVASDWYKPNGQFVIIPEAVAEFVKKLAVKKIPGVGKITEKKLAAQGIKNCSQLQSIAKKDLIESFGKFGDNLYDYCRGIDHRSVDVKRTRKSVSVEHTFLHDLKTLSACEEKLSILNQELMGRLEKYNNRAIHKQFIKIKFSDFTKMTKEFIVCDLNENNSLLLLREALADFSKPVRLLGVGVRFVDLTNELVLQQSLLLD